MQLIFTYLMAFATLHLVQALRTIDCDLSTALITGEKCNIMITMANGTEKVLEQLGSYEFDSRQDRINAMAAALQAHATFTQAPVLHVLDQMTGIEVTPYWITNKICVHNADIHVVRALAVLPQIERIDKEFFAKVMPSVPIGFNSTVQIARQQGTITYGVELIGAPKVWQKGYTGERVLVAHIDTGVNRNHEAFAQSRFSGIWYDATLSNRASSNPSVPPGPYDQSGHGTHVLGTILGAGGIGVAPGARWASCKACKLLSCSDSALTQCGQFLVCPLKAYNPGAKNCGEVPQIISCSWGARQGLTWYNEIINAWRLADIIPIFSIGNSGPGCNTANSPGDQPNVISVGAIDSLDKLADFSSRGPANNVNGALMKPEFTAPGANVVSASNADNTKYVSMSGTSMAAPHMAGTIALLLSKNNKLTFDQIFCLLKYSAERKKLSGGSNCTKPDTMWPNNSFGYGRINVQEAIELMDTPYLTEYCK